MSLPDASGFFLLERRVVTDFALLACYNAREVREVEQTVYGDLLFFVNFCMDFQCLFLTARLLHRPFPVLRSVLSSALGALYACAALFLQTSGAAAFVADCAVCFLMCVIAFAAKRVEFRRLLAPFGVYFIVSFAVGCVMSGIASLLSHIEAPMGTQGAELSSGAFFLLALLGGALTFFWGRLTQRRAKGKRVELKLSFEGKTLSFVCMVDTANLLRDPVGGKPVVLLDRKAAQGLFPKELLHIAEHHDQSKLSNLSLDLARRVRLIPASAATGNGLLLAIAPDRAVLDTGKGAFEIDVLIAPVALFTDGNDYKALLPAELII